MARKSNSAPIASSMMDEELVKIFNNFDKNSDGKISSDELRDIFHALGSETVSELDKDGDVFIVDVEEFAAFLSGGEHGGSKELRDAFDLDKKLHSVLLSMGERIRSLNDVGEENLARGHARRAELLTMAYLIYQALVFYSISTDMISMASDFWWVPLSFSLSLTLIYFIFFLEALAAFDRTQHRFDQNRMLQNQIAEAPLSSFSGEPEISTPEDVRHRLIKRRVFGGLVIGVLVAFAVVMLVACWSFVPVDPMEDQPTAAAAAAGFNPVLAAVV